MNTIINISLKTMHFFKFTISITGTDTVMLKKVNIMINYITNVYMYVVL